MPSFDHNARVENIRVHGARVHGARVKNAQVNGTGMQNACGCGAQKRRAMILASCLAMLVLIGSHSTSLLAADAANRQQAIDMALRQNGGEGKVLGVQTIRGKNGQNEFAVKILSNGRVRVFRFKQAN